MALTKVNSAGVKDNEIVNADLHSAANIAGSKLADSTGTTDGVTTAKIADSAITTAKIGDQQVTLDKLEHGTSSNAGKFLRANDGADPTFETVNTTPEGTDIISTGESGGTKFLREDGDGTCSWQTVATPAGFDDNNLINDISTLALQVNSLQNASKFATNSVYVDNFNDSAGIASFSDMSRNLNNYIGIQHTYGTAQYWATTDLDSNRMINHNMNGFYAGRWMDGSLSAYAGYISNPSSYSAGFGYEIGADSDFGPGFIMTGARFYNFNTNARFRFFKMETADSGGASGTFVNQTNGGGVGTYDTTYSNSVSVSALNQNGWVGMTLATPYVVPTNTSAWRFTFHNKWNNGNTAAGAAEMQIEGQKVTSENATGHFISNAITASSSTSSMGAVILYKDHHGTATLNTDLKVYLSADNGSNFTQGTLVALPDFATGVKMAKVNDLSVTAGTQLKYKIEVANQANAVKETRIDGVSLQY